MANDKNVPYTHYDSKQLADKFNNFFIEKVNKIQESIPEVKDKATYYSGQFRGEMKMEFEPTTQRTSCKI